MDAADAGIGTELETRLGVIDTIERNDPSRRALSGADLSLFVGVSVVIALVGILVLAL
ncbi:hypothetical protein [Marisediminicola antarctica]|uniref:hypothetical protein n=1 Tax=Marisediminicola antarctica TaxID=674079 RepID=UPI00137A24A6|nr:hypothetical protein [Marisediminicola antarctica]